MKIRGLIFDLDGVLCSTDHYHYLAWKSLADEYGFRFSPEINNLLRGVSREDSLKIILAESNRKVSEEVFLNYLKKKNTLYLKYLEAMSPQDINPEVRKTLTYLKNKGYRLAVGSSSKNTRLILMKTDLTDYFDFISDGTMIQNSKPDPEVFLLAAQGLQLRPEQCLVIEDAMSGVEAGLRGGFTVIGIGNAIKESKANFKIESIEEIIRIVESLN